MKFMLVLVLGMATGVLAGLGFVYYNPAASSETITPLMVSDRRQFVLNYSAVASDAILFTNDGESRVQPVPQRVAQLWEAPIRETEILVTELRDYRGSPVGIGIKFSSPSEETRLLESEVIVDSVWHINLPSQGTMLVAQRENHWDYLRRIVLPAHWSAADNWKGRWRGLLSVGPNALGTARVFGGSGRFANAGLEAVEFLQASAYSTDVGPVAAEGQLIFEYPDAEAEDGAVTGRAAD
jgi:hypothetical protein